MAATKEELKSLFAKPGQPELPADVLQELQSIARLHSLPADEVYIKWEAYCIKMGSDETKLDYDTVRALKKDSLETLEREARSSTHHVRGSEKRGVHATPRVPASNDVFGMSVVQPAVASRILRVEQDRWRLARDPSGPTHKQHRQAEGGLRDASSTKGREVGGKEFPHRWPNAGRSQRHSVSLYSDEMRSQSQANGSQVYPVQ